MTVESSVLPEWQVVFSQQDGAEFSQKVATHLNSLVEDGRISAWRGLHLEQLDSLEIEADKPLVCWLNDDNQRALLLAENANQWTFAFLPHPQGVRVQRRFKVAGKIPQACEQILQAEESKPVDFMFCNQQLVLTSVMIGDPDIMRPASQVPLSWWGRLQQFFGMSKQLMQARLMPYKIKTAKETQVSTAAIGLTMVYRGDDNDFTRRVLEPVEEDESSLNAVILAPRSIMDALDFVYHRFFSRSFESGSSKDYLGKLKSESMMIHHSGRMLNYSLDGELNQAEELQFSIQPQALQILNRDYPLNAYHAELKESVRVVGLPKGEAIKDLAMRPLPWIDHADPEEIKDTFVTLKENSKTTQPYLVLMVLSTLLATVGLFANSTPVIIGAMILAPLMAPIISLSMGLLRQTPELIINATETLVIGISLALLFGTLFTILMPLQGLNNEISARLSPTILDLGVAIISGIAGAYANAKSEVAKSLAGVAIAVALVPPLAVAGIGIGWMDWHVFSGAFLLFLTNLVGIVLAAATTFLLMGFSPFRLAQRGLLVSTVFVVAVSVPLVLAFNSMVNEQRMLNVLEKWQCTSLDTPVKLRDIRLHGSDPVKVSATLLANRPLQNGDLDVIKQQLEQRLEQKIELEAVLAIKR